MAAKILKDLMFLSYRAIERAGVTNTSAVRDALRTLDINSHMGRTVFAADGGNQAPIVALQYWNGSRQIVAPPNFADSELLYPIPGWAERNFTKLEPSRPSEVAIIVVTCVHEQRNKTSTMKEKQKIDKKFQQKKLPKKNGRKKQNEENERKKKQTQKGKTKQMRQIWKD